MERVSSSASGTWERLTHYVGLDWAKAGHELVGLDKQGQMVLDQAVAQDAAGWGQLRQKLQALVGPDLSVVGVAIETSSGPAVERLLELGCTVYPLNPRAARAYRQRQAPSGSKTDHLDAWSFAAALRSDGANWRPLRAEDPQTQELRLLCRDEVVLIEQRTALVNQLQAALYEYYPAALESFDDWTKPFAWTFIQRFPTPQALQQAGKRRWNGFLHTHKLYRPETYAKRLEVFARAAAFCGSAAVTAAKSRLAVALCRQLHTLEDQIQEYRRAIEQAFARHPDHDLFGSLPGGGTRLAPRMLAECGGNPQRFAGPDGLRAFAGTAPVTYQSGKTRIVKVRWACNRHLRHVVYLWANESRRHCAWAQAYYQAKKKQGKSHATTLRCLGQRWLKILHKMLQTRQPYDEPLHLRHMLAHGSWVLQCLPQPASA